MRPQQVGTFILGCLFSLQVFSQEKITFGKVDPKDFGATGFEQDTGAHAVVISDIGESAYQDDKNEGMVLQYKRHLRIKIIDRNGYEAAVVVIPYRKGDNGNMKVKDIRAITYNLEGGTVVQMPMDSKSVFTDVMDHKELLVQKFTLPAVKEGSIIEYTYTLTFPYRWFVVPSWEFQNYEYPTLYSRYSFSQPAFYDYIYLPTGYYELKQSTSTGHKVFHLALERNGNGNIPFVGISSDIVTVTWEAEKLPALRGEAFTTSLKNHIAGIEFQLAAIRYPEQREVPVLGTWNKLYENLINHEEFGASLDKNNHFLAGTVDGLTKGIIWDTVKARNIYNYVRDHYIRTGRNTLHLSQTLKAVYNSHSGNVTDINLLLVAMLRRAGLDAYPVILSTRENGFTIEKYPMIGRFNYTIAALYSAGKWYYMDASVPYLGFGRLGLSCYNGHARILTPDMKAIHFNADSLIEKTTTFVSLYSDSGKIKGTFVKRPNYYESCFMRQSIARDGKDAFFAPMAKGFTMETRITGSEVENMDDYELPLQLKYEFEMTPDNAGRLYINPMLSEGIKDNPFKSLERRYPVEMPYATDEWYTLNLQLPEGYEVEELPEDAQVNYENGAGTFQYAIQQRDNLIQFLSRIRLNKATFPSEYYASLREFYDLIVKKQSEQIVLKKKS